MTLPVVFTANGPSGYNLTKSLRFRSSASAYLNRTPASAGNLQAWTWSGWVKLGIIDSGLHVLFQADTSAVDTLEFDNGTLNCVLGASNLNTTAVFRDPAAWYHIVWNYNGATQNVYVNNVLMVSGAKTGNTKINSAVAHYMGTSSGGRYFDGYMTEVNFIGGQALTPSSFGSTNALTGVWQPAKYTGTYGTNGFYLPFTNTTSTTTLGYDFSGNSNNWTTNNLSLTTGSTYDSMTDVPTLTSATTANYCVLNPLDKNTSITASNGNLTVTTPTGFALIRSTMFLPTGKYYWEVTCTTTGNGFVGISSAGESLSSRGAETANSATISTANGNLRTSGADSAYGSAVSNGNVMMFALDMTSGKFWAGKSGTWFASGDPAAGTNAGKTGLTVSVAPSISLYDNENYSANFGQQGFTYTPPTGFVALNTYNLPTSTIVKGNTVMDATLYTGTGATLSVVNTAGFKPDFVWAKGRSAVSDHLAYDSVRGATLALLPDLTIAEVTLTTGLTSFNSNGFTLGSNANNNTNGVTYVGWQWQAGQGTTVTNTDGTITTQVSVNPSAGFSIITYTGTGSAGTIGHGLGVAPVMIITKRRDSSDQGEWQVSNSNLSGGITGNGLFLNTSAAQFATGGWLSSVSSSTIGLTTATSNNGSGRTFVAYCWAEISGFSKFGSYTGNNSADGPFVYLGFSPKFVMIKCSTSAEPWLIIDCVRQTYDVLGPYLIPNSSDAEGTYPFIDFTSNGFKLRNTGGSFNNAGGTYIYMAFASNPFKNSNAF